MANLKDKEEIGKFLESLSSSIDNENIKLYRDIINNSRIENYDTLEKFYYGVLYPWDKFISGYISDVYGNNNDIKFLIKNRTFVERHFRNLVTKYEGMSCCADKTRNIINSLLEYFITSQEINFDYGQEYTYHLPKKIFKTHNDIISFYEGIKDLYYGNTDKYINFTREYFKDK